MISVDKNRIFKTVSMTDQSRGTAYKCSYGYFITCAHCLGHIKDLISLNEKKIIIELENCDGVVAKASVLFVDYVADIVILGSPDKMIYPQEAIQFETFFSEQDEFERPPNLWDGDKIDTIYFVYVDGEIIECKVEITNFSGNDSSYFAKCNKDIVAGLSGSPLFDRSGDVVGIIKAEVEREKILIFTPIKRHLPLWFIKEFEKSQN